MTNYVSCLDHQVPVMAHAWCNLGSSLTVHNFAKATHIVCMSWQTYETSSVPLNHIWFVLEHEAKDPLTPAYSALLITSYCTLRRKDGLCALVHGFCVSRKNGVGEGGGIFRRVLCTWQLLGLAVKGPWLAQGGPISTNSPVSKMVL